MIRWGSGRSQGGGCCIVLPIGCLLFLTAVLLFSGLAVGGLIVW